jgi:hypothetical protein
MCCMFSIPLALSSIETMIPFYLLPIQGLQRLLRRRRPILLREQRRFLFLLLFSVYVSDTTLGTALF